MQFELSEKICCKYKNFKESTKSWISIEKVSRVIKFNQKAGLKQCIDINTKLRRNAKNDIDKDLFKLMNNSVFCKNHEKYGKNIRYIKLLITGRRFNYLLSKPNYIAKWFLKDEAAIENKTIN